MPVLRQKVIAPLGGILLIGLWVMVGATAHAQSGYEVLDNPQPTSGDAIEVREFFSYGCSHCHSFEPRFSAWAAQMGEAVDVVHTPVTFGRESWVVLARAYYAAQALGIIEQTHRALFDAIHNEGRRFSAPEDIADFYAEITAVSPTDVLNAMNSFAVNASIKRAERLVQAYRVAGTPSLGVDGRYSIDVRAAGGQQGMLDVAQTLVADVQAGQ